MEEEVYEDTFIDDHIFPTSTLDPWYRDIIIYLQMLKVPTHLSRDEQRRLRHVSKNYFIVDNTLYCRGVDSILRYCLTHEEAEVVLNDFHGGACGGHLSGLSTAQNILRAGYFWPSIFKDCVDVVKRCHPFQVFACNMCLKPAPLHPIITVGTFTKWGLDFMYCNPASTGGHHHIIVAIDYFMKWVEAMPTIKSDGETASHFVFNQIITRFGIPRELVTDHGSHFQNHMMEELASKLGYKQENSSCYYPQVNGQVEAVNKSLKSILQ